MAAIPAEFGGGRVFLDDPDRAGSATALGDMAAVNLQLLHLLGNHIGDGFRADRDRLAGAMRNALQAANAHKTRESSTRELQTMNAIPDGDYGATTNLGGIRINQLPQFSGATNDPREVVRWIARVLRTAEAHTLTLGATIHLMVQASTGSATDYIDGLREEGKDIGQIIRNLELRYGELCMPEEALTKANTLARGEKENISDFLDKVRYLAKMAKRGIANVAQRTAAIDDIVMANIRRALSKGVRRLLEERIRTRTMMGQPPFTAMEIEKECVELEQRKLETKQDQLKDRARMMPMGRVHMVARSSTARAAPAAPVFHVQETPDMEVDSSDVSSSDEAAQDGLAEMAGDLFAGEVRRIEAKYAAKGVVPDKQRVFRRAIRGFNKRQGPAPNNRMYKPKPTVAAVTSTGVSIPASGPPNKLPESPRKPIHELLALANCQRGDCLHCGVTGHMMTSDACPLRGKPLVDRACMKCKKGLHPVDDCLSVFQQPAKPAVAQIYESSEDSDLNEE